jgi:hypothetical protein
LAKEARERGVAGVGDAGALEIGQRQVIARVTCPYMAWNMTHRLASVVYTVDLMNDWKDEFKILGQVLLGLLIFAVIILIFMGLGDVLSEAPNPDNYPCNPRSWSCP